MMVLYKKKRAWHSNIERYFQITESSSIVIKTRAVQPFHLHINKGTRERDSGYIQIRPNQTHEQCTTFSIA